MLERKYLFPNVIELNYQAGRRMGVNVYLIDGGEKGRGRGGEEFVLIDIGYEDNVPEVVELIRLMDYNLSACKMIIATHADADHVQGLARAKELLHTKAASHRFSVEPLETADEVMTFAHIKAQDIHFPMPKTKIETVIDEGDRIAVGDQGLEVWHTPGHTAGQLAFRLGKLLFSGDNIFRDSSVGVIDAHHGSNLPDFIKSLERIRDSDVEYLLPSHGPIFKKDNRIIEQAIGRLTQYQYLADFGTCAVDWPLLQEWDREIAEGLLPR